ncbi:esterase/lipase family protein [Oleiphilus messinensis]|nr:hypothetical protein [Oleiphilus messinensis]
MKKRMSWRRVESQGISILNGILGDYLVESGNPLAIDMGFYHQSRLLEPDHLTPLIDQYSQGDGVAPLERCPVKLVVLLHGLTNDETIWDFPLRETMDQPASITDQSTSEFGRDNYGLRLARDARYIPLYLRYNTGLKIMDNAHRFSALMTQFVNASPVEVDEIVCIGFSMGGLLLRYAQLLEHESTQNWLHKVSRVFYLGSPHSGAPLEKLGHIAGKVLGVVPRSYVNIWADWVNIRSQGIKDLRHGVNFGPDQDEYLPFNDAVRHFFISGAVSSEKNRFANQMVGDALVRVDSARPANAPALSEYAHFDATHHLALAHSDRVYEQILKWCQNQL